MIIQIPSNFKRTGYLYKRLMTLSMTAVNPQNGSHMVNSQTVASVQFQERVYAWKMMAQASGEPCLSIVTTRSEKNTPVIGTEQQISVNFTVLT